MEKNITLENPKINTEEENFYYDRLTGKPFWDLRKMLGRQLFKIRQDYCRPLNRVSQETKIPIRKIDNIELGRDDFQWPETATLLDYYKKRVKLQLVNTLSDEERKMNAQQAIVEKKLEQAEVIIEKAKQCEALEKEITKSGEIMTNLPASSEV